MKFVYTEKKIQVPADVKAYAEKKIGKLDKYFRSEAEAFITFSYIRGRYTAEVTLHGGNTYFRVKESTGDIYAAIDSAVATIERQIGKNKTRLEKRLRQGAFDDSAANEVSVAVDETVEGDDEEFQIVRSKRFPIKPMTVEEAILQMNLLSHEFFVFKNADMEESFSVVYRRKDGGYGLISDAAE